MSASPLKILVVDDEPAVREILEMRLARAGYQVALAETGRQATQRVAQLDPDIVISDVMLPDVSGLDLLERLKKGNPQRPVILITAYGTVDSAVEAMKRGALDFLTKPLDHEQLQATLDSARSELTRRSEARHLEMALEEEGAHLGHLVGRSPPMLELYEQLRSLGASDAPAILTGESGTGKELTARTLHELGGRSRGPFVAVNTSAIPEGLIESELFGHTRGAFTGAVDERTGYFEMAHGGTLFLDEIAEMPAAVQPKLLRVLEDGRLRRVGGRREREVDVRVLAATNRNPHEAVEERRLREDLFFRLSVFTIELPPLRRRLDDLPILAQHFVRACNEKHQASVAGVGDRALQAMHGHRWPGNVRELRNVIERAVILARRGWIEPVHLPPLLRERRAKRGDEIVVRVGSSVAEAEKKLILETLKRMGNNKTRAARVLGLDVRTIRYKIRSYENEA